MPALVQPHSSMHMQDPDPATTPWETSFHFKTSLGKRQRDGDDEGGVFSNANTAHLHDAGMGGGVGIAGGNVMGIALGQEGGDRGSLGRFGMKRLKSTSDTPSSFSLSSSSSSPYQPNPPAFLHTTSSSTFPFASSSMTNTTTANTTTTPTPTTTCPTYSPNPFFPTAASSVSTPGLPSGSDNRSSQNGVSSFFGNANTNALGNAYPTPGPSTDYALIPGTGSLSLQLHPHHNHDSNNYNTEDGMDVGMEMDAQDMEDPFSAHPNAPPPSLYSMASSGMGGGEIGLAPGPSTYDAIRHQNQLGNLQQTVETPQGQNPAVTPHLGEGTKSSVSVSPNDGYAEPYWREGIRGLSSVGLREDNEGSPGKCTGLEFANEGRGTRARMRMGAEMGSHLDQGYNHTHNQYIQQNRGKEMGVADLDLGRSVAMAMGMGVDSRMTHGDVEMDTSPVFSHLRLPQPSPVDPNFIPTVLTDHPGLPTTPVAPTFDIAPSAPVNTPATTPTRQNAVPNLFMTGTHNNPSRTRQM
ncbi:hypothetical protein FFLO_02945 [Filobasidium floriforme]|uniref:Uncharacterized protein n=1 Tax=Filobasidium floriforme TaxID=5210 RepID=A0A8K0JN84_9TREE|nr:hypothetical protein FFLO_02945 [Filobasidium floriforme]